MIYTIIACTFIISFLLIMLFNDILKLNSEINKVNNRICAFHERLSTLRDQIMQRIENDINKIKSR